MTELPKQWLGRGGPFLLFVRLGVEEVRVRLLKSMKPVGVLDELLKDKEGLVGQVTVADEFQVQVSDSDIRQFYPILAGHFEETHDGTAIYFHIVTDPLLKAALLIGLPLGVLIAAILLWVEASTIWVVLVAATCFFYLPIQFAVHRIRYRDVLEKFYALFQQDCIELLFFDPAKLESYEPESLA
ncbi:MAG: hypothetical protein EXR98_17180 [Gemmataceae bacterium]|nr:hypothetical protein [Gemmataceae bacterium]